MTNFILIFLCLVLGVLLKRTGRFPVGTAQALNAFVIYISMPALIFVQIPALFRNTALSTEVWIPISMSWLVLVLSFIFFRFVGYALKWNQAEEGAVVLTAGLGNTSFVGFPLLETFFGPSALRVGVLVDQVGTFLALSTLGIFLAARYSGGTGKGFSAAKIVKNIVTFPPFIALILAILWHFTGTAENPIAIAIFERLSATLIPLALVAVGFQLQVSQDVMKRQWRPLTLGLLFKLILAPALLLILYVGFFGSHTVSTHITLLEAAMAPMITASIVAMEFGLNAEIASLMVGVGIPLSLVTVPVWHHLLEHIL